MTDVRPTMNDYSQMSVDQLAVEAKLAKGGSWLVVLAMILGKIADKMGENLVKMAQAIDTEQQRVSDGGENSQLTELNAKMNAYSQTMNMFMQATSNIIKSLGEGNTQIARKSG
ncbi:hypothetical protein [Luteimonas kalidii]|uniref:Uncharacterized protein n=1 Tax=Luteimonas kalidii TaxID=3042025 RepID=A0ABT6JUV7_9GAMM|nr:hypothetical protein [Luteimonas kalidii]MDH5834473.1 hypothetical protein [Luteimonas kalidii]